MGKGRGRGKPAKSAETLPAGSRAEVDYDATTPKFCLAHIQKGYDVKSLPDLASKAAFAEALQIRSSMTWRELKVAPRHGLGMELIPKGQIRAPIPEPFQDHEKFVVFRYNGRLPMAGVRILDVFHVLWIEARFGDLYDHGS